MIFKDKLVPLGGMTKLRENITLQQSLPKEALTKIFIEECERIRFFSLVFNNAPVEMIAAETHDVDEFNTVCHPQLKNRKVSTFITNLHSETTGEFDQSKYFIEGNATGNLDGYSIPKIPEVKDLMKKYGRHHAVMKLQGGSAEYKQSLFFHPSLSYLMSSSGLYTLKGFIKTMRNQPVVEFDKHTAENIFSTSCKEGQDLYLELDLTAFNFIHGSQDQMGSSTPGEKLIESSFLNDEGSTTKTLYIDEPLSYPIYRVNDVQQRCAARFGATINCTPVLKFYNQTGAFVMLKIPGFGKRKIKIAADNKVYDITKEEVLLGSINPITSFGYKGIKFSVVAKDGFIEYRNLLDMDENILGDEVLFAEYTSYVFEYGITDVYNMTADQKHRDFILTGISAKNIGEYAWPYATSIVGYRDHGSMNDNSGTSYKPHYGTEFQFDKGEYGFRRYKKESYQNTIYNFTSGADGQIKGMTISGYPKKAKDTSVSDYKLTFLAGEMPLNEVIGDSYKKPFKSYYPFNENVTKINAKFTTKLEATPAVVMPYKEEYNTLGVSEDVALKFWNEQANGAVFAVKFEDKIYSLNSDTIYMNGTNLGSTFLGSVIYVFKNSSVADTKIVNWCGSVLKVENGVIHLVSNTVIELPSLDPNYLLSAKGYMCTTPDYSFTPAILDTKFEALTDKDGYSYLMCVKEMSLNEYIDLMSYLANQAYKVTRSWSNYYQKYMDFREDFGFTLYFKNQLGNSSYMSYVWTKNVAGNDKISIVDETNSTVKIVTIYSKSGKSSTGKGYTKMMSMFLNENEISLSENNCFSKVAATHQTFYDPKGEHIIQTLFRYISHSSGAGILYDESIKSFRIKTIEKEQQVSMVINNLLEHAVGPTFSALRSSPSYNVVYKKTKAMNQQASIEDATSRLPRTSKVINEKTIQFPQKVRANISISAFGCYALLENITVTNNGTFEVELTKTKIICRQNGEIVSTEVFNFDSNALDLQKYQNVLSIQIWSHELNIEAESIPGVTFRLNVLMNGSIKLDELKLFNGNTLLDIDNALISPTTWVPGLKDKVEFVESKNYITPIHEYATSYNLISQNHRSSIGEFVDLFNVHSNTFRVFLDDQSYENKVLTFEAMIAEIGPYELNNLISFYKYSAVYDMASKRFTVTKKELKYSKSAGSYNVSVASVVNPYNQDISRLYAHDAIQFNFPSFSGGVIMVAKEISVHMIDTNGYKAYPFSKVPDSRKVIENSIFHTSHLNYDKEKAHGFFDRYLDANGVSRPVSFGFWNHAYQLERNLSSLSAFKLQKAVSQQEFSGISIFETKVTGSSESKEKFEEWSSKMLKVNSIPNYYLSEWIPSQTQEMKFSFNAEQRWTGALKVVSMSNILKVKTLEVFRVHIKQWQPTTKLHYAILVNGTPVFGTNIISQTMKIKLDKANQRLIVGNRTIPCEIKELNDFTLQLASDNVFGVSSLDYSNEVIKPAIGNPDFIADGMKHRYPGNITSIFSRTNASENLLNSSTVVHAVEDGKYVIKMISNDNRDIRHSFSTSIMGSSNGLTVPTNDLIRRFKLKTDKQTGCSGKIRVGQSVIDIQDGTHEYDFKIYFLNTHTNYYEPEYTAAHYQIGSVWMKLSIDGEDEVTHFVCNGEDLNTNSIGSMAFVSNEVLVDIHVDVCGYGVLNILEAKHLKPIHKLPWHYHIQKTTKMFDINSSPMDHYLVIGIDDSLNMKSEVDQICSGILQLFESAYRYNVNLKVAVGKLENGMYIDHEGNEVDDQPVWLNYEQSIEAIRHREFALTKELEQPVLIHSFVKEVIRFLEIYPGQRSVRLFTEKPAADIPIVDNKLDQNEMDALKAQIGYDKLRVACLIPKVEDKYHEGYDYIRKAGFVIYPEFMSNPFSTGSFTSVSGIEVNTVNDNRYVTGVRSDHKNLLTGNVFEAKALSQINVYNELMSTPLLERAIATKPYSLKETAWILNNKFYSMSVYYPLFSLPGQLSWTESFQNQYVYEYRYPYYLPRESKWFVSIDLNEANCGYGVQHGIGGKKLISSEYGTVSFNQDSMAKNHLKSLVRDTSVFDEFYRVDLENHEIATNALFVTVIRNTFTTEERAKVKEDIIKAIKNLKLGDVFAMHTVNDEQLVTAYISKCIIYSEKKRNDVISKVKAYEFEDGTVEDITWYEMMGFYNKKEFCSEDFSRSSYNILSMVCGHIKESWPNVEMQSGITTPVFTVPGPVTPSGKLGYNGGVTIHMIASDDFDSKEDTIITTNIDRAIRLFNENRVIVGKTTLRLNSESNDRVAETLFGNVEYSESKVAEDKMLYVRFFGKKEKEDEHKYHVAIMAYGMLFCIPFDEEMKEYEIVINNPHNDAYDGKPVIEAYRQPEQNTNPMLIEKCPFMIVDDYNMMDPENKLHSKHGMVYAKNASVLIDEIMFDVKAYGNKGFFGTNPPAGSSLSEVIGSDAIMPDKETKSGQSKMPTPKPDEPWMPKYQYPQYPNRKPEDVKHKYPNPDPNEPDYEMVKPQYPPNTTPEQKKDKLKDWIEENDIPNTGENDPIFDPENWEKTDPETGDPISDTMNPEPPLYIVKEKVICSDIHDFVVPKPGSYDALDKTALEIIEPNILNDQDIVNTMSYNLEWNIVGLEPKTDYPFQEPENPYGPDKERPIGMWKSDIYASAGSYSPHNTTGSGDIESDLSAKVRINGGYIGQYFSGDLVKKFKLSRRSGLVTVLRKGELALSLKNVFNKPYAGDPMVIVQTIEVEHPDEIIINDIPKDDILLRAESITVETTLSKTYNFDDENPSKEIIPGEEFELPEFEAEYNLVVVDETNNIFVDEAIVNKDDKINVDDVNAKIALRAGHHIEWEPWQSEEVTKSYTLNGDNHLSAPLAGVKDVKDFISVSGVPSDTRSVIVTAEAIGENDIPVTFKFANPISSEEQNSTEFVDDQFTISSDYTIDHEFLMPWTGPTVLGEREIAEDRFEQNVEIRVKNPEKTMAIKGKLENIKLSATTNNPNVRVLNPIQDINFNDALYLDRTITVKPFSTEISKWSPKVMPGFYYFYNEERYLYVDSNITLGQREEEMASEKTIILSAVIKMNDNRLFDHIISTKLIFDQTPQFVTKNNLIDDLYPVIISAGYTPEDVVNITLTPSEDIMLEYEADGKSRVTMKSKETELYMGKSIYFDFNDEKECIISPIPKQFAPVIVKDENVGFLNEVCFVDKDGKLTLEFEETLKGDGTRDILLSYNDIDKATLSIVIDGQGMTDYELFNNVAVSKVPIKPDAIIKAKYKIKNSFIVDYNYDPENNKAMIKAHTSSDLSKAVVVYESSDQHSKIISDIELNSIYNPVHEGFVYISDVETYTSNLDVMINPKVVNKGESVSFYIKATDEKGSAVSGDIIILDVKYGKIEIDENRTDKNGIVQAIYVAPNHSTPIGAEEITVTDIDANITKTVKITVN